MKTLTIKLIMYISTVIVTIKTPLIMGVMLLLQTMLATIFLSKIMKSSWMMMIMFLMLIGGLLILFMYMSSIASNEKFTPNIKILMLLFLMMLPLEQLVIEPTLQETEMKNYLMESMSMIKMYNKKTMMITTMVFLYLFLCMIAITSIIKIYKGPLRSK